MSGDDLAAMFDKMFGSAGQGAPGSTPGQVIASMAFTEPPPGQTQPRSQKPRRGKSVATIELGQTAFDVLAESEYAMTLRHLYYRLVAQGAIPKDHPSYIKLGRVMRLLREDGTVPWEWLVDHVRSVIRRRTWDGVEDMLGDTAELYRRDLMRNQDVAIQLWAESDSIGSVIAPVAQRYTIPTFIGRGYSSRGYLWTAAKDAVAAHEAGKTVLILHVGDFDPSGLDIFRDLEETLRLYAFAIEADTSVAFARRRMAIDFNTSLEFETNWLDFQRLALTAEQVEDYELPTAPAKTKDTRTAGFIGIGTVEVEALPVEDLLAIVETAITNEIDPEALRILEQAEKSEREIMRRIAATPIERLVEAAA